MVKLGSGCADAAREPVRSVSPLGFVFRIGVLTRAETGDGALVAVVEAAREVVVGSVDGVGVDAVAADGCWWCC
jgi:hypothetical protein